MEQLKVKIEDVRAEMAQHVAHVKTGLQEYDRAVEHIHEIYMNLIASIRYPGEPPVYAQKLTQADRAMQNHFEQNTDKGK
ncbi:MAG: hypothetical protein U0T77_10630 [Chitinophagales bacterium]